MSLVLNRKARYEYLIMDEYDAGIVLLGPEVKSIRNSDVTLTDSYVYLKDSEVWIKNLKVARYKQIHAYLPHEDNREKKLLLTKKQIKKISKQLQEKGVTCVPLEIFEISNRIKVKIAIVRGKKTYEKRQSIKKKDDIKKIRKDFNINVS